MKNWKRSMTLCVGIIALLFSPISVGAEPTAGQELQGTLITEVFDYGPNITRISIPITGEVTKEELSKDTFSVHVLSKSTDPAEAGNVIVDADREVVDVFPATEETGEKVDVGNYIIIELKCEYEMVEANVIHYSNAQNYPLDYQYTVTQNQAFTTSEGLINPGDINYVCNETRTVGIEAYESKTSSHGIQYQQFTPEDSDNKPLIIWLHGGAEGGDNNMMQMLASKSAVSLAGKETQDIFDGAYVVLPQAPSFWGSSDEAGNPLYIEPLTNTIQEIIDTNPGIDQDRVYIGGTSAGGYMTWQMLLASPERYAAAFLASAANIVTEEEAELVKEIPMWIIHSGDDMVAPMRQSMLLASYMEAVGGTFEFTKLESVQGLDQKYDGHWTFIPLFNHTIENEEGVTVFEWVAKQKRGERDAPKPIEKTEDTEENTASNETTYYIVGAVAAVVVVAGLVWYFKKHRK